MDICRLCSSGTYSTGTFEYPFIWRRSQINGISVSAKIHQNQKSISLMDIPFQINGISIESALHGHPILLRAKKSF
jgi:hypothetical protein